MTCAAGDGDIGLLAGWLALRLPACLSSFCLSVRLSVRPSVCLSGGSLSLSAVLLLLLLLLPAASVCVPASVDLPNAPASFCFPLLCCV